MRPSFPHQQRWEYQFEFEFEWDCGPKREANPDRKWGGFAVHLTPTPPSFSEGGRADAARNAVELPPPDELDGTVEVPQRLTREGQGRHVRRGAELGFDSNDPEKDMCRICVLSGSKGVGCLYKPSTIKIAAMLPDWRTARGLPSARGDGSPNGCPPRLVRREYEPDLGR